MAGMGKVKALQIWCRNRVLGYRDVEITNMTTSWRNGLAFCALIHRFRPDLIDFESLSKENVLENNALAFEVAESLGVPALLDAEDMVRLETPDKLSIITYVAQLHNCFKDSEPVGGPSIQVASKRHSTPVTRSTTMKEPDSKRKSTAVLERNTNAPSEQVSPTADICVACDGKVYLIEKHIADGKLYHRSCFKRNNRKSDTSALRTTPKLDFTPLKKEEKTTPSRPVDLGVSGLKKTSRPSSSLPATPSSPVDTRPEWQRRLQEKSAARKTVTSAIFKTGLEPLNETDSTSNNSTPSRGSPATSNASTPSRLSPAGGRKLTELPKTEAERVVLRSRTPPVTGQAGKALPRAVSVGVNLDEKLSKLRQLRESGKANAATKARLEKLKAATAAGMESLSGSKENVSGASSGAESPVVMRTKAVESVTKTEPSEKKEDAVGDVLLQKENMKDDGAMEVDEGNPLTSDYKSSTNSPKTTSDEPLSQMQTELKAINEQTPSTRRDIQTPSSPVGTETTGPTKSEESAESNDSISSSKYERITPADSAEIESASQNNVENSTDDIHQDKPVELSVPTYEPSAETPTNPFEETEEDIPAKQEDKDSDKYADKQEPTSKFDTVLPSVEPVSISEPANNIESVSSETSEEPIKTSPAVTETEDVYAVIRKPETRAQTTSMASMNLSSTPSAPTRAKRAQGIKTVNRSVPSATSTTTPVSSLSTEAAQKPSNNTDLPAAAAEIISPPRRPLSAINITVSSSPNNSRRSSVASLSNISTPDTPTAPKFPPSMPEVEPQSVSMADSNNPSLEKLENGVADSSAIPDIPEVLQSPNAIQDDSVPESPAPSENSISHVTAFLDKSSSDDEISAPAECEIPNDKIENEEKNISTATIKLASPGKEESPSPMTSAVADPDLSLEPVNVSVSSAAVVAPPCDTVTTSLTPSCMPSAPKTSPSEAQATRPATNTITVEEPQLSASQTGSHERKSPKPARPPVSPALSKKHPESTSRNVTGRGDTSTPGVTPATAVHMRNNKDSNTPVSKVPTRPQTVAVGTPAKSQFYMDPLHKSVTEPPPKPTRQSMIEKTVTKAKDNWESSLENWSMKRKEGAGPRSTWYSAESYPTEHNPFGDDEEDESETTHSLDKPNSNHNNAHAHSASKELKKYDKTLNPFGDLSPGDEIPPKTVPAKDTNLRGAPAKEVNGTSHEKSKQKKIIPANPFEVSDEEEEVEQISRKRLTVPEEIKSAEKPKKSPNTRHHDKIILPSVGKTAPKKKHAPAPPPPTSTATEPQLKSAKTSEESAPVINADTPPKSNTNGGESISESLNNSVNSTDSKFNELDSSEIRSPDMIKRRSKPAPPRPMPPKRRVQSEFGLDPDDISRELAQLDAKQLELEEKGRVLEQAIRKADTRSPGSNDSDSDLSAPSADEDELLSSWLETINEKNHLVRRESELVFIAKHHELETQQADIEWELRQIMNKAEALKTDADKSQEEDLLQRLVTVVHERSKLVDKMDDERQRQMEEDEEINSVLSAKFNSPSSEKVSTNTSKSLKKDKDKKKEKKEKKKEKKK